ncbi:SH3 domain-containing protein [Mediannikoviicoccus vaginalis]|uniref:SH3 domain-containing protein n=1 Tax=Mediannikoviicoccus vaginalis TaxID=2899727 RepID=UPI001F359151|nr:SH3 domain-containing protein [Mediannikoviicoccus vaginalis]
MESKPRKKISLRSLDQVQFFATAAMAVLSIITIITAIVMGQAADRMGFDNLDGIDKSIKAIYRVYNFYNLILIALVVALLIFLYTTFIRNKLGKNFLTVQNIISCITYGIFVIDFILFRPILSVLRASKRALKNIQNLDFGSFGQIEQFMQNLMRISEERVAAAGIFFVIAMILAIVLSIMLYRRIYHGQRSINVEREVSGFTEAIREKSQVAKELIQNQVNEFKETDYEDYVGEEKLSDRRENPERNNLVPSNEEIHVTSELPKNINAYENYQENKRAYQENKRAYQENKRAYQENKRAYQDYDREAQNYYNENRKPVNKKLLASILIVGILLISAIFIVPKVLYAMKPDAVISLDNMDIEIEVAGFDGSGTATATLVGEPEIIESKKVIDEDALLQYIKEQEVKLSKSEGLKNGDKVKAVFEFKPSDRYKIEIDKERIEKEIEVEDLEVFINSYKDIDPNIIKKLDQEFKSRINNDTGFWNVEKLRIQRLGSYEYKVDDNDIKTGNFSRNDYTFTNVYKVSYRYFDNAETEYVAYAANNFQEANGAYRYNVKNLITRDDLDDLLNSLQFDGYTKIDELKEEEALKEEPTEATEVTEDETEKENSEVIASDKLSRIAANYENNTRYVGNVANLRSGPSVNSQLIKTFHAGTPVQVLYTDINDNIRVWCYVRVETSDEFYEGWISHRVIH